MRNVRNWWIETWVDGDATVKATGPKSARDGFSMTISQRDKGKAVVAAVISGFVNGDKLSLTVRVNDKDGAAPIVATFDTER